ncbi:MAG: hypothetical protein ABI758_01740 [Candidatus Woesebacteria bacterium]
MEIWTNSRWNEDSIYHFKADPAKLKQPPNSYSLHEHYAGHPPYQRVKNHIILGLLCDFVPQLIIPDDELFHATKTKGEVTLEKIQGDTISELVEKGMVSPLEFLALTQQSFDQMRYLYERFGILLEDRRMTNAMLSRKDNRLYQVDLEDMYNVSVDTKRTTLSDYLSFTPDQLLQDDTTLIFTSQELSEFISSFWVRMYAFFLKNCTQAHIQERYMSFLYPVGLQQKRTFQSVQETLCTIEEEMQTRPL